MTPYSHILMIYIEPTPYIMGLVHEVSASGAGQVQTLFIHQDLTQSWGLSLAGYNVSLLPSGRLAALVQIWRSISAKPGLIHLSGWGHPLLFFALLAAGMLRVPVAIESDTQLPVNLPGWKRLVKALCYPWIFRIPAMFLPGGSRQAAYLRHYGVPADKIMSAQMTVDVKAIQQQCAVLGANGRAAVRQRLGIDPDDVVCIFIGRLVPLKGLTDLLAAFEQAGRRAAGLTLVVVGDGPERARLQAATGENRAIRLTGRLDQQGVVEMFHAADFAVVPSHIEAWGLVVNEAMASGLPVIASDRVGAVDDLVIDGETGIVYPAGDVEGLTLAMLTLARDHVLRERYADAARRLIAGWTLADSARIILQAWQLCGHNRDNR